MSFWSWLTGGVNHAGDIPNANPPASVGAGTADGDPHGVDIEGEDTFESRALGNFHPSPWAGWPAEWSTPNWDFDSRYNALIDVAWTCLDKNASVLSAMPVYRTSAGKIVDPTTWMINPDPRIYTSWVEFAKQLFWDYQMGEAFVMLVDSFASGFPMHFRIVPPWAFHVEMVNGARQYRLGGQAGPIIPEEEICHIRYKSTTDGARGVGPLSVAGGRMLTASLLARYVREVAGTGGVPVRSIHTEKSLDDGEAQDLITQYLAGLAQTPAAPPVFDGGTELRDHPSVSPREMAMHELAQFNEAGIAVLLGVPPFLVGLPSGGDSMTYSNVSSLFDFHDRSYLRTAAAQVMSALSYWALPRGQAAELNRDEYTRPAFNDRAAGWEKFVNIGAVSPEQVARYERFQGEDEMSEQAMTEITGGEG